jgi:predicted TIM-barrel fold metal-dependent hydrolase
MILDAIPVVDSHCHPWRPGEVAARHGRQPLGERVSLLGMCLASSTLGREDADDVGETVAATPFVRAFERQLAAFLGVAPNAVSEERSRRLECEAAYVEALMRDANVEALVYDEGYPCPRVSLDEFALATGRPVFRVVRLEQLVDDLVPASETYSELRDQVIDAVEKAAGEPRVVALKSVIAYRTGLAVAEWTDAERELAYSSWRANGLAPRDTAAKPVRDGILAAAVEACRRTGLPLHVHCGGGDPDIVLGAARPSDLFPFLRRNADHPIVLIHAGWPWVEEAAYVAAILPNVYLDLSLLSPWSSIALEQKLDVVLATVSPRRLIYASDEATEPEVVWFGAHVFRAALARVLERAVTTGWIPDDDHESVARAILRDTTVRLHRLERW